MMAKLYVFDGIDERKQLATAEKYSNAGLDVDVHYHNAWDDGRIKIECNEKCIIGFGKEADNGEHVTDQ